MTEDLLRAYDKARSQYRRFVDVLQALLTRVLAVTDVRVHSVAGRVKERDSFQAKVVAAAERYQTLGDVTDVAGIRVITYFADDVERIGRVVEQEFDVLDAHSSNKRDLLSDREFGYLSLHYVVRLKSEKARLPEYRELARLLAEVQVRSILQHAWAEIEHDLGYTTSAAIPVHVRREFARLAALLEGADDSFVRVRDLVRNYEDGLRGRLTTDPGAVDLDVSSLRTYLRFSPVVAEMNHAFQSESPFSASNDMIARHVRQLAIFGIHTIGELDDQLRRNVDLVISVGRSLRGPRQAAGSEVLPVIYLEYLLLTRCPDQRLVEPMLRAMPPEFRARLLAAVSSARSES